MPYQVGDMVIVHTPNAPNPRYNGLKARVDGIYMSNHYFVRTEIDNELLCFRDSNLRPDVALNPFQQRVQEYLNRAT